MTPTESLLTRVVALDARARSINRHAFVVLRCMQGRWSADASLIAVGACNSSDPGLSLDLLDKVLARIKMQDAALAATLGIQDAQISQAARWPQPWRLDVTNKKTFPKHWRQGDVLVVETSAIPATAEPVEREGGRAVLAHGELTGHAHAFTAPQVRQFKTPEGRFYFEIVGEAAPLQHEEHTAIPFAPSKYRNARQVEYSPAELRNVAD